jgi:hypothetical protein
MHLGVQFMLGFFGKVFVGKIDKCFDIGRQPNQSFRNVIQTSDKRPELLPGRVESLVLTWRG